MYAAVKARFKRWQSSYLAPSQTYAAVCEPNNVMTFLVIIIFLRFTFGPSSLNMLFSCLYAVCSQQSTKFTRTPLWYSPPYFT